MKKSPLRGGSLSGNGNFAVVAAQVRFAFNHADSIIVCVAMRIIIRNGNTSEPILSEQGSLRFLKNGNIRAC